ncbi:MAG TPA: TIGR03435 family protein [Bryobacteraceae bacterium]|nr:TIGR03435 family protein [Bryobacteraceae bacterium]
MRLKACLIFSTTFLASAQTQTPSVFEIASVKPSHSHTVTADGQKGPGITATPTFEAEHVTFRARNVNLFTLIVEAYGLKFCRPLADRCAILSGGPAWLTRDSFDVDAKGPSGSTEYDTMQLRNGEAPQLQEKLRNLLADRFRLKTHFEKRQLPVFGFTIAESGIRMKKANAGESPKIIFKPVNPPGGVQTTQVIAVGSTLQELAELYSKFMDRPVIDMTELTDRFDFTVQYEADNDAPGPFAAVTAPTLFQAFEKQAGLKLRATQGPVNVLVIDSAARLSAN